MLTTSSYDQLKNAQMAIGKLKDAKPSIYRKFINIIKLTRQLQFGYQYMGALIMMKNQVNSIRSQKMIMYCLSIIGKSKI